MRGAFTLCLGLLLAPPVLAQTEAPAPAPMPRQITVTGEGRIEAAPDLALVSAGVETEAPGAAEALAGNSEAMARVLEVLTAEGVAEADIQTSQITLIPVWADPLEGEGTQPRIAGYAASNVAVVRVRALDTLGAVLDALARAGANRIDGISFALAEPRSREDAAREAAVADARDRAELYARAAGLALGPVLSLTETPAFSGPGPVAMRAEAMAMDVPVAEGTLEVVRQVEMTFAID